MNPLAFIAVLFCTAVACLFGGAVELYDYVDYRLNARNAVMVLADPAKKVIVVPGGPELNRIDVKYIGPDGEVFVKGKAMSNDHARMLGAGGRIPVTYMKNNPQRALYAYHEPPKPWGWLAGGVVLSIFFVLSLRLKRREDESHAVGVPPRAPRWIGVFITASLALAFAGSAVHIYEEERDYANLGKTAQLKPASSYVETTTTKKHLLKPDLVTVARTVDTSYVDHQGRTVAYKHGMTDETFELFRRGAPVYVEYIPGGGNRARIKGKTGNLWTAGLLGVAFAAITVYLLWRKRKT